MAGPDDPAASAYTPGVPAALPAVATARPDLQVEQGQPLLIRRFLFVVFLGTGAILAAPLSMVLERPEAGELWRVSALLGACMLFCAVAVW